VAVAAALAPVTARAVAAFAVAAFALAALTVAVLAVAAFAAATFPVAAPAARARDAIAPVAAAAALLPAARRLRDAGVAASVVGVDPERGDVPCRCDGPVLVAFSPAGFREVPRPVARVEPLP
jgi:hypothetical protein